MTQGRHIETVTLEELFSQDTSGAIPILADVVHENIIWKDDSYEQENHHLRLINDTTAVKYKGHVYMPAYFGFVTPQEDGKKIGNTTITISAIDQRIIEVIRSITENPPRLIIETFFCKTKINERTAFQFSSLGRYEFRMTNVRWNETTAQWDLVFDPAMQLNVPVDTANEIRCPAVNKGAR